MKRLRVVIDTNVYLSGTMGGNPGKILELFVEEKIMLLATTEIIAEVRTVLLRVLKNKQSAIQFADFFERYSEKINSKEKIQAIKEDPSDNKFLECAVSGNADYIVSGDKKHVLPLRVFRGIPIVTPKTFLESL